MLVSHSLLTWCHPHSCWELGSIWGDAGSELSGRAGAGIGTLSRAGAGLTNSWLSSQPRFPPLLRGTGTCSSHVKRPPLG